LDDPAGHDAIAALALSRHPVVDASAFVFPRVAALELASASGSRPAPRAGSLAPTRCNRSKRATSAAPPRPPSGPSRAPC
jgi:hypothetical protein